MQFIEKTVIQDDADIRVNKWFLKNYSDVPLSLIAKLLRKKDIKVNGKKAEISYRLQEGDVLRFPEFATRPISASKAKAPPKFMQDLEVIYKDDDILAINKPAGIPVQGGSKVAYSIDDAANHLKFDYEQKPRLVHRLDRDTSGVLLLARNRKAAVELMHLFQGKSIKKEYMAVLHGVPHPQHGKMACPLPKEGKDGKERMLNSSSEYEVLDYAFKKASLVRLSPITGRKHQLRIHCANLLKCPIIGDDKYCSEEFIINGIAKGLHLHAYKISFNFMGKDILIQADVPENFRETLNVLGLDAIKL